MPDFVCSRYLVAHCLRFSTEVKNSKPCPQVQTKARPFVVTSQNYLHSSLLQCRTLCPCTPEIAVASSLGSYKRLQLKTEKKGENITQNLIC